MAKAFRKLALMSLVLAPLALATVAHAQLREFKGKVDSIDAKAVIVDNRKGDKIKFDKIDTTAVKGEKTKWEDIKKGEWVAVSSKMLEKPRKAYEVTVMPAQQEAGEDE